MSKKPQKSICNLRRRAKTSHGITDRRIYPCFVLEESGSIFHEMIIMLRSATSGKDEMSSNLHNTNRHTQWSLTLNYLSKKKKWSLTLNKSLKDRFNPMDKKVGWNSKQTMPT